MAVIEAGDFRLTEKLNQWLQLKGWDQRKLAAELGCDESLVSQWQANKNPKKPSWQSLRKLCLLTGLDVGDLLTFDRSMEKDGE